MSDSEVMDDEPCATCGELIIDNDDRWHIMYNGVSLAYHEDHFACSVCRQSLMKQPHTRDPTGKIIFCMTCHAEKYGTPCSDCGQAIVGPSCSALGKTFHPQCLKCNTCDTQLGGKAYFAHADNVYCKEHIFAAKNAKTGKSAAPSKPAPSSGPPLIQVPIIDDDDEPLPPPKTVARPQKELKRREFAPPVEFPGTFIATKVDAEAAGGALQKAKFKAGAIKDTAKRKGKQVLLGNEMSVESRKLTFVQKQFGVNLYEALIASEAKDDGWLNATEEAKVKELCDGVRPVVDTCKKAIYEKQLWHVALNNPWSSTAEYSAEEI